MFNLPAFTAIVLIAVPSLWILYTLVFLVISRNYKDADSGQ